MIRLFLPGLLLCASTWAQAEGVAPLVRPFVRGSQQAIIAAHQGKPFVLALWSPDCTHCRDDLTLLGELQARYRKLAVVLVATDAPARQREIASVLTRHRLHRAESWMFADNFVERLRYEIDPQWYGELPRTYFFDARGQVTAISGKLSPQETEAWVRGAAL